MFIISLTYIKPLTEVEQHFDAHMAYVKNYYQQGVFLASGKKVPRTGGVILAKAESLQAIEKIVAEDPFCLANLVKVEITEFLPTNAVDELSFLLSAS